MHNTGNGDDTGRDEGPDREEGGGMVEGLSVRVQGVVQGVGFRPFVANLAESLGLTGRVANTGAGVEIVVCGPEERTARFLEILRRQPPPLARIHSMRVTAGPRRPFDRFTIADSDPAGDRTTLVPPDIATCDQCLADIFSPGNRRHHYPFTNCTGCGPRLTIIHRLPYDRPATSMASFAMCPACRREYHDPADRRFHAQPTACPACGPSLSWHDRQGRPLVAQDDGRCLAECALALEQGAIVAIKGLGGFHLAVDAGSGEGVRRLRRRKRRPAKPLAVMAADLSVVEEIALLADPERALLRSRECPIVLVRRRKSGPGALLAPGIGELGVMLPYTPLHHLLFARPGCPPLLVMTSGNPAGEPICTGNREGLHRLAGIADFFLLHDRGIVTRVDDSIVRWAAGRCRMIRRARGYVPLPLVVEGLAGSLLACGAELKNTFALSRDGQIFAGQHIGDLRGPDNLRFFRDSVHRLQELLSIRPQGVVCDLHPDYLSSRYAAGLDLPCTRVQHHHAHAAAVMAEHNLGEGLAVVYDGAGLGPDNTVWGGEFLHVRGPDHVRLGHLAHLPLPGGDRAAREIWRMGLAILAAAGMDITDSALLPPALQDIPPVRRRNMARLIGKGLNTPPTSSVGRLFDAVCSLVGIRQQVSYEGQAAMELEFLARQALDGDAPADGGRYDVGLAGQGDAVVLDFRPMLHGILADMERGIGRAAMALSFHDWLVRSTATLVRELGRRTGLRTVLLGGGCFQNRLLLEGLTERLEKTGFRVYSGEQVPVNDGGISVGQIWVAAAGGA